jgi:hypothetical protein
MKRKEEWAELPRDLRLRSINEELCSRGLRPLHKLGDAGQGEIEIIGISKIIDDSKPFFIDVIFHARFMDGGTGRYTVRFYTNSAKTDGAVIVTIINDRLAIVKQWRTPLGRWTYEIPRGGGESIDAARIHGQLGTIRIGDLPLGTMLRELGEEVMSNARVVTLTHLGNVAENTGTHNAFPAYFLVHLHVDSDARVMAGSEKLQSIRVELWPLGKAKAEMGGKLCDNHSITALALAMNYIDKLSAL